MIKKIYFINANGTTIHIQEAGNGFPIVFVHAGIANLEMWEQQVNFLADNYRAVAYDMRGFGKSPTASGEFAHYQDLISLLNQLDIPKCILVGCSKGGGVVMDTALADPERIAGMIVAGGMAYGLELDSESEPPPQWEQAVSAFKAGDIPLTNEMEIQIWVDGYNQPVGRADPQVREKVRKMNEIVLRNELATPDAQEKVLEPKAGTRLNQISAPILFIYGSLDEPDIDSAIEKMVQEIPGAKRRTIQDVAHMSNMEKPEEFNQIMLEFIETVLQS